LRKIDDTNLLIAVYLALLLSSVVFTLSHTYRLSYFIITFFGRTWISTVLFFCRYRGENIFLMSVTIHAALKFIPFSMDFL